MRAFAVGLVIGLVGWLLLGVVSSQLIGTPGSFVVYTGPLIIGVTAGFLSRGLAGLLGVLAGIAGAYVLAVAVGPYLPPPPAEVPILIVYYVIFFGLTALGYAAGRFVQSRQQRSAA